ncbi:UbiA family prenyltransferase [Candidatus Bathyarchaeota archaeon A05DMB-2]|jgi:4-hydroxybenzoate polyprenyltransferase|nr:UbiA family prenyltransferase [Candidatus Bathyarchaeota archaeon A05DMB-2]
MKDTVKAYVDLTRLHFFFVWPTLLCAGLFLAFQFHNNFSWLLVAKVALIGFFGFEAGLILNDILDWKLDKKDVEFDKLTKYWRVFGKRPISQGLISQQRALLLFGLLVAVATALIFTLPFPQSMYLFGTMVICYCLEVFYQIKKRNENFPVAQLVGRIDFTLFPVAGYLCLASPDLNVLLFAFFFYPLAQAHLGVNDIIDVANDQVKEMKTISILYGMKGTAYWILLFSIIHIVAAVVFFSVLRTVTVAGFAVGFLLISIGNYRILRGKSADAGIKALPLFHVAMLIYAISIILGYVV